MADHSLYRISFVNQGQVYEVYSRRISQSDIYGFVQIGELVFSANTTLVVDPSEERLKDEFKGVQRSLIPMHSVIRIDEVSGQGVARIRAVEASEGNVMPFPSPGAPRNDPGQG